MIQSMTGYGKQELEVQHNSFTIEIKTLNSKQLDLNMRIPQTLKSHEMQLRTMVSKQLNRGKVDVSIFYTEGKTAVAPKINNDIAQYYYKELNSLSDILGEETEGSLLPLIVRMPDVFYTPEEEWSEDDWRQFEQAFIQTTEQVVAFRKQEGSVLEVDFKNRINKILELLDQVNDFETERVERIKERIKGSLDQLNTDLQYDPNRLEQELIYYLEKLDITEEKVRLKKHCEYFLEILDTEAMVGKKLGFVLQEIGREINTLGSKSNNASLQKIVVLMKDELEKIKEQMLNIL